MIRDDFLEVSDYELKEVITPFEEKIKKYIKYKILSDYVSFYIANSYHMRCLWKEDINAVLESAMDSLGQISVKDCNLEDIKSKLIKQYNLEIINSNLIDIIKRK